jgi:hypothetical protein
VGETVRICADLDQAKVFNKRVGWKSDMDVVSDFEIIHREKK